jgi:endonuclease/exonuclease/phosphatase family metal-dependent hydrolase
VAGPSSTVGLVRLLTWNLSDLDVTSPGVLEDPRVAVLAGSGADVICLQKVCGEAEPDRTEAGLAALATNLGMSGALSRAAGERLHVAVLWRAPWTLVGDPRPRDPVTHRNHLLVDLHAGGGRLRVGSVHLPVTSVEDQLHDLELLLAQADDRTVLAGDWNATSADPSYDARALEGDDRRVGGRLDEAGLVDAARAVGVAWVPTWRTPDGEPFVRIDAFRLAPSLAPAVTGLDVHTDVDELSLHRPVELALALSGSRAPGPTAGPR